MNYDTKDSTMEDGKFVKVEENVTMSMFDKQKIYQNGWSNSSLDLLKKWSSDCIGRMSKHAKSASKCRFRYNCISIPSIITGSFAAALAFWAIGEENGASYSVRICIAFFSSLSAIFKGTERLFNFPEEEQRHLTSCSKYEELSRSIDVTIFVGNNRRDPIEVTLKEISLKFSSIVSQSPSIN